MIEILQAPESEWTKHFSNVYSQFGEDGIIEEIFRRIGTTNKQCFEVGAADGKWFSNSRKLIDDNWSAALIEADEKNWPELDKLDNTKWYDNIVPRDPSRARVEVVHGKAEPSGPDSLDSILAQCGFDERMDLGIIDVDGQDYYLWNGMLKYRPRVMMVEYDRFVDQNYVPDLNGGGQAGLAAICSLAVSKGYFNVTTTETNLVFVLNAEREKLYGDAPPQAVIATPVPVLATGKEQEIKIAAILSRPRYGTGTFWDCASEALSPWHIPIQSFQGVFYGQCMQTAMEDNIAAGVDWILALDFDSMFTSKHLGMLIDTLGQNPDIDAIAPLQSRRGRPLPLMVRGDGQAPMTGGPIQVTTAHFGLTLIRCDAIQKMQKPWFWSTPTPQGTWGEGRLDDDIFFWGRFRDAHNKLFVHTGVKIGHIEEVVAEYDDNYNHRHTYVTAWRKANGFRTKAFD